MLANFHTVQMGGELGLRVPAFGTSDPMNLTGMLNAAFRSIEQIRQGVVITYVPNTHTASVLILGTQSIWPCIFADEPLSLAYGYSSTNPVREGEIVLVYQLDTMLQSGVIIGRIPFPLCFCEQGDAYKDPDEYHRRLFVADELEKRTWDRNIPGMMKPMQNPYDNSTHVQTHMRPTDIYPGEWARVNQHNCGIKGGMFSTTLLGGGSSLRLSALSNLARLTAKIYQRYSISGIIHEFHNGRYTSIERKIAMFQEERFGGSAKEKQVWKEDAKEPINGRDQTMRPRILELSGFFGHLESKFCLRPDPSDGAIRVQGKGKPKEEGVFRETTDPSGQHRITSAGMLVLERAGRIPVPVRKAYPSDVGHDIQGAPKILKPFVHKDGDPGNRQLELYDRQAYDLKNQYARAEGLGTVAPDYDVPEEEELKPLTDKYDPKIDQNTGGNETVKLAKFDKRRAGVYMGEDGSVIIRDAWGSEIVMLGGNIQLSCAGNIMTMPGKTALTIAGDDIVQKAQNSVDIHASEHDVRLSAARNMEIRGGGDEKKYPGGVIIESVGSEPSTWDGKGMGEEAKLSGITLRTKNQAVVVDGKIVNVRSKTDTRIISGDKALDGTISIAAEYVRSRAKSNIFASSAGKAHLIVNGRSVQAVADNIALFATKNLLPVQGMKYPVPLKWETVGAIPEEVMPSFEEMTEDLQEENKAARPFDRETLDKMIFGFRKSIECGTNQPWVIGASGQFRLYEPAWVQVMKVFETLKNGQVNAKPYEEKAEWENGKPFPGEEAEASAKYAKLSSDYPQNLTPDGFNKPRNLVKEETPIKEVNLKGGYMVRE